ncbi:MAG: hypothetical protein JWL73_2565 [Actinomycetia bacterium]|nr:hypothetical protein [Actinomycetes bacterium]
MTDDLPAWHPDPAGRHEYRYWDGTDWTDHVSDGGERGTDPVAAIDDGDDDDGEELPVVPGKLFAKGRTGTLEVDDTFVTIRRKGGFAKVSYGWTRGEKRIPIASITAVQFKRSGVSVGYIQFTIAGGNESTRGVRSAVKDENSVAFVKRRQGEFERIRDHIEGILVARHAPQAHAPTVIQSASAPTLAEQLRDLAGLRDDGILTADEFEAQKARLLQG